MINKLKRCSIVVCSLYILVILSVLSTQAKAAYGFENERFYSDKICEDRFKGEPTTIIADGTRVYTDCETSSLAIEFDWAYRPKNYECFGQAGFYAKVTGKTPVCVLIARTVEEYEFGEEQYQYAHQNNVQLIVIKLYKD